MYHRIYTISILICFIIYQKKITRKEYSVFALQHLKLSKLLKCEEILFLYTTNVKSIGSPSKNETYHHAF